MLKKQKYFKKLKCCRNRNIQKIYKCWENRNIKKKLNVGEIEILKK